jgi:hypothetical protein
MAVAALLPHMIATVSRLRDGRDADHAFVGSGPYRNVHGERQPDAGFDTTRQSGTPLLLCNGLGARLELLQPLVDHLLQARAVIRQTRSPDWPAGCAPCSGSTAARLPTFTRGGRLVLTATAVGHQLFPASGRGYADQLLAVSA